MILEGGNNMVSLGDLKGTESKNIIASIVTEAEGNSMMIDGNDIEIQAAMHVEVDGMDSYIFFVGKDHTEPVFGLVPTWTKNDEAVTGHMSYIGKDQAEEGKESFLLEAFKPVPFDGNFQFQLEKDVEINIGGETHQVVPKIVLEEFNLVVCIEKLQRIDYKVEMPMIIEINHMVIWIPIGKELY